MANLRGRVSIATTARTRTRLYTRQTDLVILTHGGPEAVL